MSVEQFAASTIANLRQRSDAAWENVAEFHGPLSSAAWSVAWETEVAGGAVDALETVMGVAVAVMPVDVGTAVLENSVDVMTVKPVVHAEPGDGETAGLGYDEGEKTV